MHTADTKTFQIADIDWDSKFDGGIHLNDGTVLRLEVELVDEAGTIQPLRLSGFSKQGSTIRADYSPMRDTKGFVEGRKFTQVRIRSDIPFDCMQVVWIDYDPK